ncbi:type II secretion system protein GspL [Caenimonas aquaedulcis]|uniref:General secretion pathway protein GspL n=1 Tax=Caenimonas aquaedulcis TaxID=2793270 RepID=A0A931H650_9BURK|nr:type II secretion system protein GspL [Caenimonas aquaedulcis]MBG9389354.1 general secretion pathway protein GspL [Caenimonas aquaedulcis]
MSSLVVLLPTQPASPQVELDYATTIDGTVPDTHGTAAAVLLPAATRAGTEVVAVIPAAMISWHRVELPKGTSAGSPRLRAVLEGLLEDQLLDEPESLHFALQPQARAGGRLWVAACDREWLRSAVQLLENAGRAVTRIVPEFAPEGETVLYALGDPDDPQLVSAGEEGVTLVPLSSVALPLLPEPAQGAPLIAEPAVAALAEQVLQRPPGLRQPAQRWLRAARTDWDFAQFEFSSSGRARALKRFGTVWADMLAAPQWRPARWGAVLLVALNLIGLNAWAWRERSALDDKRENVRKTLTQTFPQVKVVVDAPVQMEKEVAALRQSTGATSSRDLEAMMAALAVAAPPQRAAAAIDYTPGELRVRGLALSPDEARNLAGGMRSQGYSAVQQGDALVVTQEVAP